MVTAWRPTRADARPRSEIFAVAQEALKVVGLIEGLLLLRLKLLGHAVLQDVGANLVP